MPLSLSKAESSSRTERWTSSSKLKVSAASLLLHSCWAADEADGDITVDKLPLSDPSAPQMTDLADEMEVEILDPAAVSLSGQLSGPEELVPVSTIPAQLLDDVDATHTLGSPPTVPDSHDPKFATIATQPDELAQGIAELSAGDKNAAAVETEDETAFFVDTTPAPLAGTSEDDDLFYVDTAPEASESPVGTTSYVHDVSTTLGQRRPSLPESDDEDEEIVFAPRTYKQPQPITLDPQPQASSSRPHGHVSPPPVVSRTFVNPKAMTRAQKKTAKKEKKKGKRSRRANRQAELAEASDVDWGSDGPPDRDIMDIDGVEESDGEDDVAVLRDYLAGTLLNERTKDQDEVEDEEEDEELDSDEVDEAIDTDLMKQFGEGVRGWNGEGIADSDASEEEDDSDDQAVEEQLADDDDDDDSSEGSSQDGSGSYTDDESDDDSGIDVDQLEHDIDRQLAEALEQGEEDSEMEELFTGKEGWGDDTDWFIQSMEVRLAGLSSHSIG